MTTLATVIKQTICLAGSVLAFSWTAVPAVADEPPTVWTAREAVVHALLNSPDSRIARQRIAGARAAQDQAAASFQPNLNLSAGYGQTNNPMHSFGNILNQGSFDNSIDFNDPGRTDNLAAMAEVTYRFYNGGRDQAAERAAESRYQASETERTAIEHQLGFQVVRIFQTIKQAEDQVAARDAEVEAINGSLMVATARYEAGDLLWADLLHFEVQQARASEQLIIAKHQLELARKNFLNLLDLPEQPVRLAPETDADQPLPQSHEHRQRPEIKTLSARIRAMEAELAGARGATRPTLDGFASYQYDRGWETGGDGDSWMAGLQVRYNLYDGGRRDAAIAGNQAELAELKERLAKLQLAVNLEVQEAELNRRQAAERRTVTEKMVQVARESAQLNRERFRQGVILASDLIDSEVRLTDALVRQSAARANCRTAIAMLRLAVGLQQFAPTTEELLEKQP